MDIYKLLKLMSSQSKAKIIALFLKCRCHDIRVTDICEELSLQQANVSKHLSVLRASEVLNYVKEGKDVYYEMNLDFLSEWGGIVKQIIAKDKFLLKCTNVCKECAI